MDVKMLNEIEAETLRFLKRLTAVKTRLLKEPIARYGCYETGAVKRAAIDLKNELTRLNKSS